METNDKSVFIYIQGQKDRGGEIIAELERRSGTLYGDAGKNCSASEIYYINDAGDIVYCKEGSAAYNWVTKHYTEFALPNIIPDDKQLVWAWDNDWKTRRDLVFYDAKYNCAYASSGRRCGGEYDNYVPYEGTTPGWAIKALNVMEE